MTKETVKIKSGKDDYTIINAEDFDESTHKLFVEKAKPASASKSDVWEDFPGALSLQEAGFTSPDALKGWTLEELTEIKGIGNATATHILEKLS